METRKSFEEEQSPLRGSVVVLTVLSLAALIAGGCAQNVLTSPPRSATEQLLLSTAADRALAMTNFSVFDGKRVFVNPAYYESYDSKYVLGTVRDLISQRGGLLVDNVTNSDVVAEPRSGALSIDNSDIFFGLPAMGVPIPLAGTFSIPEFALFKVNKQDSIAKFALLAYETHGRGHYFSTGPLVGKAYSHYYKFLGFIIFNTSDIPAKHKPKREKHKTAK